jgi:erythrin-vacuolar iron transport family protein
MMMVVIELFLITWIQHRYMETPWMRAALQVLLGGTLVFAAGVLIGNA